MDNFTKPIEELANTSKEYVDLKIDDLKLKTVKGLSISLNHLLSMILVLFTLLIVFLASAFGGIMLLGSLIGSYSGAAFIVAGIFLIIAIILYMLRNKLFLNQFIKLFVNIFFEED